MKWDKNWLGFENKNSKPPIYVLLLMIDGHNYGSSNRNKNNIRVTLRHYVRGSLFNSVPDVFKQELT